MLVSEDINPKKSLYYIGSKIIKIIKTKDYPIDLIDLYNELSLDCKVSFHLFTLTLDWLYLIQLIEQDEEGNIVCL